MRKKKYALERKWKRTKSAQIKAMSTACRNEYNKSIRACKRNYFLAKLHQTKFSPAEHWKIIKKAANLKGTNYEINEIVYDDSRISDHSEIADTFNEHFSSIGIRTTENIPLSEHNHKYYLPPPHPNSFLISGPSPNDVVEITYSLNNKKTSDVNGLSINMLKQIVECIAEPLSIIFTASIEQGIFPHIFKVSKTVPVFKKEGSRTNAM